jgi:hypothetical protein
MNRLTLSYLVLWFLFLTFLGFGSTHVGTLQLGPKLAQAEDSTKHTQAAHDGPCKPTRPDMLGPFYVPNAPERTSVGKGHILSGVVRSSADCSLIAGTRIEFWLVGDMTMTIELHCFPIKWVLINLKAISLHLMLVDLLTSILKLRLTDIGH